MTPFTPFVRSSFTWLAYFMLGYYAYLQSIPGPVMPFLRQDLDLSYTLASLHFSAFALGMVIAGLLGDPIAERWGRKRLFWVGALGMGIGGLAFALGFSALLTVLGALLMGTFGSFTLVMIQSTLADAHGPQRAIALTEANVMAGVGVVIAPLMVGLGERSGVGWQLAPLMGLLIVAALQWAYRGQSFPARDISHSENAASTTEAPLQRLPSRFWRTLALIFFVVCIEWSLISWAADYLETEVGLSKVNAASAMSLFFGAFLVGRILGSRLTRYFEPRTLLGVTVATVALGFMPFWMGPFTGLHLAGLVIAGLGVSNLFPMTLSMVSAAVPPALSDRASGRISLTAGTAVLAAPQVLGTLADQIGLRSAYSGVILLILIVVGLLWLNRR
jgi:MFS family permease